jgi:hypothetical protein
MTGTSRATPVLVWSRAGLLAVVVVLVSTLAHTSADGLLPGPLTLGGLVVLSTVLASRFLTRQVSARRVVALLVIGQTAIHGALSALAGHRGDRHGHEHVHPPEPVTPEVEGCEAGWGRLVDHLVDHLATQSPAMVLTHLLAVAALGAWLAVGERALWTVLTLSTTRLVAVVTGVVVSALDRCVPLMPGAVRRTPVLGALSRDAVPLPQLLHHVVAHRGPPPLLVS